MFGLHVSNIIKYVCLLGTVGWNTFLKSVKINLDVIFLFKSIQRLAYH